MFRDDDVAHGHRANALIDEIADLERKTLAQAAVAARLDAARHELSTLHQAAATPPPGVRAHLAVFVISAALAALAYTIVY